MNWNLCSLKPRVGFLHAKVFLHNEALFATSSLLCHRIRILYNNKVVLVFTRYTAYPDPTLLFCVYSFHNVLIPVDLCISVSYFSNISPIYNVGSVGGA